MESAEANGSFDRRRVLDVAARCVDFRKKLEELHKKMDIPVAQGPGAEIQAWLRQIHRERSEELAQFEESLITDVLNLHAQPAELWVRLDQLEKKMKKGKQEIAMAITFSDHLEMLADADFVGIYADPTESDDPPQTHESELSKNEVSNEARSEASSDAYSKLGIFDPDEFKNRCYLSATLEAILDTPLKYLFDPAVELPEIKGEAEQQHNSKLAVQHALNLWFETKALKPSLFEHFKLSGISPALFQSDRSINEQQDARLFLEDLLNAFLVTNPETVQSEWKWDDSSPNNPTERDTIVSLRLNQVRKKSRKLSKIIHNNTRTWDPSSESPPHWLRRRLVTAPNILIFHLDRFEKDPISGMSIGRDLLVVPNMKISLPLLDSHESADYKIVGVISHEGEHPATGHYSYFEIEGSPGKESVRLHHENDTPVDYPFPTEEEQLEKQPELNPLFKGSYLLFYQRIR